jgi:dihydroxyacid dehydratase/phosphogluconate dehydratase
MGTSGMSFSLQSRDLIADSIETVMGAQWYDANVALPGTSHTSISRLANARASGILMDS